MKRDRKLVAVCGLDCKSCTLYIASSEDRIRLKRISNMINVSESEAECHGCRSDVRFSGCTDCHFVDCSKEKNIDFCSQCDEFPCSEIIDFQKKAVHRLELWRSLELLKKGDLCEWTKEMNELYSCSECRTMNSAYDVVCRSCGNEPGSEFIARHKSAVVNHLKNIKTT